MNSTVIYHDMLLLPPLSWEWTFIEKNVLPLECIKLKETNNIDCLQNIQRGVLIGGAPDKRGY